MMQRRITVIEGIHAASFSSGTDSWIAGTIIVTGQVTLLVKIEKSEGDGEVAITRIVESRQADALNPDLEITAR